MTAAVLGVYLIHWNAPDWCASAARSVLASTGIDVAVTVIDNGSDQGPAVADLIPPTVRVLPSPTNVGFAGAANIALSDWRAGAPDSDFCVIASHDLQVEPDSLKLLVEAATHHRDFGVLAPAVVGPVAFGGGGWNGWRAFRLPLDPATEGVISRPWVAGTCMLLRRQCADDPAVGGFDERLSSYLEDVDICLRARAAGWSVGYVASSRVSSIGSISPDVSYWTDRNTILLAAKYNGLVTMARTLVWVASSAVFTAANSLLPWRGNEKRAASRRWSGLHWRALRDTLGNPRLLRSLLRERHRGVGDPSLNGPGPQGPASRR